MDLNYEETYAAVEEHHPWFVARRDLFTSLAGRDRNVRILDVGCGTGIFLAHLKAQGFEDLTGVEPSSNLRSKFRDPSITVCAEFPESNYEKIFMLDVLEHIEDDRGTLRKLYRALEPGGELLLSVPAHPFLWNHHDDVNRHQRRYRHSELRQKILAAGFRLHKLSYWNSLYFLPICLVRWLNLGKKGGDLKLGGGLSLRLYGAVLKFENWCVERFPLPMGVSLIAVAEKPAAKV